MRRLLTVDIRRERRDYKTTLEWVMQLGRAIHMEWGDPLDVVNGIQPCPFVYLVNGMYIIVMLTA